MSPLIGRQDELARTLDALSAGRRLITLVGPGGVGKSRLLVEVGARLGSSKEVSYQELSGLDHTGAEELAATLAMGLGLLDPRIPPVDALIGALTDGDRLLLMDEAELVAQSLSVVVGAVLEACPGVQVLLTSRVPLDVSGELLIAVDPLECPGEDADADAIGATAAVQFLTRRLTDRAIVWDQTPTTAGFLASIARSADGLPLALEIAAGQAAGRSPAEVVELIGSPLDVPATGRFPTERHRSLRDALTASVDGLDPLRRTVLRRLSVFAGRFDVAAAGAVVGIREPDAPPATESSVDVAEVVRSLARDSLLHIERTGPTRLSYRLLRPIRELAAEGFDLDELAATRARHRRWYARMSTVPRDDVVQEVRDHFDDCLLALETALTAGDVVIATDLLIVLTDFWRQNGGQVIGLRVTTRVLDSGLLTVSDRGRVLAHRAALALHHSPDVVLADSGAAIDAIGTRSDRSDLVLARTVRAIELYARGHWRPALEQIDIAVTDARAGADEPLLTALSVQAMVRSAIGDSAGAMVALRESRALIDTTSSRSARVAALTNLAFALLNLQRPRDALLALDEVAIESTGTTGRRPPDFALLCSGWAALAVAEPAAALRSFVSADPLRAPGIADRQSAENYLGAACALAALDDPAAADLLAAAIELTQRVQLVLPPPFAELTKAASARVEKRSGPDLSTVPITVLLDRLAGLLGAAVARAT